ncbi:hypothetical protein [Photobacterium sanctipauli]|uniref:hypothetical protein n=1 Tax=Photobacterium sanctipauli TaxID=1342794 RepID=UPI000B051211|nr:hypothetical protein [Photobacterium sanctipauli]
MEKSTAKHYLKPPLLHLILATLIVAVWSLYRMVQVGNVDFFDDGLDFSIVLTESDK